MQRNELDVELMERVGLADSGALAGRRRFFRAENAQQLLVLRQMQREGREDLRGELCPHRVHERQVEVQLGQLLDVGR